MDILEIKKFNEPILKKKAKEVKSFDRKLEELVLSMKKTMLKYDGMGLAAPQIGVSKRIFVYIDIEDKKIKELINPKIIKYGKESNFFEEGCLSFPGIFLKIKRKNNISVEGFNLNGDKIKIEAIGIVSRVIQHETDHLNGILFFDRLPFLERIKFKIENRNFKKYLS